MLKNKNLIIIAIAVIAVILVGVGIFLFTKSASQKPVVTQQVPDQQVLTLSPADIGLSLSTITSGKFVDHGVQMAISKVSDITSVDYELSYTSKGDIPRGAIGHIDVKPTDATIQQQLPFGTCSDVCHFDQDVTNVKMTLKVTKKDGKIYSVDQTFTQ